LTLAWFSFIFHALVLYLYNLLSGTDKCSLVHQVYTVASSVIFTIMLLLHTRRWMVAREVAGEGVGSPAGQRVSIWDVQDLRETRMGLSINVGAMGLVFGTNWYRNCMGGGG